MMSSNKILQNEPSDGAGDGSSKKRKADEISGKPPTQQNSTGVDGAKPEEKQQGEAGETGESSQSVPTEELKHTGKESSLSVSVSASASTSAPMDIDSGGPSLQPTEKEPGAPNADSGPAEDKANKPNAESAASPSAQKKEKKQPNDPYENLRYITVENDGKEASMIKLVGLKSLFAKQLPKMPRAYIARLVFDRRHTSLAILSDDPSVKDTDEEIIGGICYRQFAEMRFAEIAFCAVNANHQVKGYGTKLMNLLKKTGAQKGIEYFITYADNYAIGYFKKQGFSKSIQMPRGRYFGYIKDYDGGTPMECYVHPSIDFTRIPDMLEKQREFLLSRVKPFAASRQVYPPLQAEQFQPSLESVPRAHHAAARALAVPGVVEAGWTLQDLVPSGQAKEADRRSALKSEMLTIVRKIHEQQFSWPFREPVDPKEVPDYLEVIKNPIDLSTMEKKVRSDSYKSKNMLYADLMLMVNNCKLYNDEKSAYVHCAVSLAKYLGTVFRKEEMKL